MPGRCFTECTARPIIHEALSSVAQCHSRFICHRDIKPANFLFLNSKSDRLRMIDFGLATTISDTKKLSDKVGSFPYVSPDVLRQQYGLPSDLWSLGVVCFELISARLPFLDEDGGALTSEHKLKSKEWSGAICGGVIDLSAGLSKDALDFFTRLLDRDPDQRITAREALSHPWFTQTDSTRQENWRRSASFSIDDRSVVQRLQRWGASPKLKRTALVRIMAHLLEGGLSSSHDLASLLNFRPPSILNDQMFDLDESEKVALTKCFGAKDETAFKIHWFAALVAWERVQDHLGDVRWRSIMEVTFKSLFISKDCHLSLEAELSIEDLDEALCGGTQREKECPIPDSLPQSLRELGHQEPSSVKISLAEFEALLSDHEDLSNFEDCLKGAGNLIITVTNPI